VPKKIVSDQGT
jgi:hypothetical protein